MGRGCGAAGRYAGGCSGRKEVRRVRLPGHVHSGESKMKPADLRIVVQQGEGTTLEFKESPSANLTRDLVAMANTIGGRILLGVRDDRSVAGLKDSNSLRDRIEVVSPGGLPKGMTLADLGKKSVRRNALIADLLHRIDFIEKAGTGVKRIRDEARDGGYPEPVWETNGFTTAIFRPNPEVRAKVEAGAGDGTRSGPSRGPGRHQVGTKSAPSRDFA